MSNYDNKKARYVSYYTESTLGGKKHYSVNVYDDVLKWITYPTDYVFSKADGSLKQPKTTANRIVG